MPLLRLLLLLAALLAPALVRAQACAFWHQIAFSDGQTGCLSEYAIARDNPVGFGVPLAGMINAATSYNGHSVAVSGAGAQCPRTVGMSASHMSGNGPSDPNSIRMRESIALESCRAGLRSAGAAPECTCQIGWSNNRSPLGKGEFAQLAAGPGPAPQRAAASLPPPPRGELPAAAAAPSRPPVAGSGPSQEQFAALQQRLADLEAARPPARVGGAAAPRLSGRALVIGNSRYSSFGALPNPGRDARAIAAKLRSFGIQVDLLLDAQRDELIQALNEHSRKATGVDVSILFYAGHGVQVEGVNYIIPVNMKAEGLTAGYIKLAGISLEAAIDYMPGKMRIVFLDACRDSPAVRSLLGSRGVSRGLAPIQAATGTLVAYATRDGATADDGDGQNSPYTAALLRHLDNPIDISLVLRQVRQTVLQLTRGRQEPWEYGSLVGEQIVLPLMAR